jgi:hypothetical protein
MILTYWATEFAERLGRGYRSAPPRPGFFPGGRTRVPGMSVVELAVLRPLNEGGPLWGPVNASMGPDGSFESRTARPWWANCATSRQSPLVPL